MAQITLRDYLQETEDAISTQRVDDALANCQYILAYFPDSLEAQRLLGEVYLAQGRLEESQQAFDWVLTNDPENVIAYCSRALVSERMNDYDTALDCYQQAYELSRGNGQIRQAFNQLSEKIGQRGFMFSRAGLARLYLRGDLLSQSIQEWDAVLAMTPDRLDARTGLLEAYWRTGLYDRVSQLATHILQDVPGCEKALLLQAHVTAPQNMLQAQEFLKRAEALDPDLVMAQDLFADLLASQPGDPFLKLLKKEPASFAANVVGLPSTASASVGDDLSGLTQNASNNSPFSFSSEALSQWGSIEGWSNDTTLVKPKSNDQQPAQENTFSSWASAQSLDMNNLVDSLHNSQSGISSSGDQSLTNSGHGAVWDARGQANQTELNSAEQAEPWQLLQDALNNLQPDAAHDQSLHGFAPSDGALSQWPEMSASPASDVPPSNPLSVPEMPAENPTKDVADQWNAPLPKESSSAPPAWVSMLTQSERNQPEGASPLASQAEKPQSEMVRGQDVPAIENEPDELPTHDTLPSWAQSSPANKIDEVEKDDREDVPPPAFGFDIMAQDDQDEEDESSFGPEWLRSIGAASYSMEMPAIKAPAAQEVADVVAPQIKQEEALPAAKQSDADVSPRVQKTPQEPVFKEPEATPSGISWLDALEVVPQPRPVTDEHFDDNVVQQRADAGSPISQDEHSNTSSYADAWQQMSQEASNEPVYDYNNNWSSFASPQSETTAPVDHWSNQSEPSWLTQIAAAHTQSTNNPWEAPNVEELPAPDEREEQGAQIEKNLITTLEDLEQKLLSHGFVPLEPKSLSTIAQEQDATSTKPFEYGDDNQSHDQVMQEEQAEPSLYSAIAELGKFSSTPSQPLKEPVIFETEQKNPEPLWLDELRTTPTVEPASSIAQPGKFEPEVPEGTANSSATEQWWMPEPAYEQQSRETQQTTFAVPGSEASLFEPTAVTPSSFERQPEPFNMPFTGTNHLLENELETTMKRPAVRLQPMQRMNVAREPLGLDSHQNYMGNEKPAPPKMADGNQSYRDRLLQGYQSQLVGDYDRAMQEYRIIIRNAPELLGDVVSNVRALLKLAPKYSAGYRVLGDAYMRQGEYLQAMEAYNKALTMAKKAKS